MRHLWRNRKASAFSLVELLVVIAIIALLAALLLPALNRGKARARRVECIGDLNQLGTAFHMFSHDHRGRFPMQTPVSDGGSMEYVQAGENISGVFYFSYRHFQPLAGELVQTKPLLCPADTGRLPADNFGLLQNSNISYFVGVDASFDQPLSILAGDRNITNDLHATASLVRGANGLRWTSELHFFQGNVLFSDAHVQEMNNAGLDLPGNVAASENFFLPAVRVASATIPVNSGSFPPTSPAPGNPGGSPAPGTPGLGGSPSPSPAAQPAMANSSNPPAPAPSPPPSMATRAVGSRTANGEPAPQLFSETDAKERKPVAVTNGAPSTAAPTANDEAEPPLVWLLGAARALISKVSWWLLLLILLLLGLTLYFYAKRKMRERQQRKGGI
jgi:prepilin-type N-terminal cleavage/methylation domain-containing protein